MEPKGISVYKMLNHFFFLIYVLGEVSSKCLQSAFYLDRMQSSVLNVSVHSGINYSHIALLMLIYKINVIN